jgi:uncharacterized protein (TIGR02147 family)
MTESSLSIYQFSCPHTYLNETFKKRVEIDPEMSLRKWSKLMGLKSHLALKKILNKETLLKKSHYKFLQSVLKLDGNEEYYFLALIDLLHAKTLEEQNLYQLTLSSLSPGENYDIKIMDDTDIFKSWLNMAVLSLSKIRNLQWSPENLLTSLKNMQPSLEIEAINEAIATLLSSGVITINKFGEIRNLYNRVTTKTAVNIKDSHLYYEQVSDLAKSASSLEYSSQKEFQCFSTALKKEDLPQVQILIRDLRSKISKIAGNGSNADDIYQVNLQLFPISDCSQIRNKTHISNIESESLLQPFSEQ